MLSIQQNGIEFFYVQLCALCQPSLGFLLTLHSGKNSARLTKRVQSKLVTNDSYFLKRIFIQTFTVKFPQEREKTVSALATTPPVAS